MDQPQTFRSTTALVVWIVWVLFAVANWIDLAVQGRDHASVVAAAVLLLATGIAYVTALRPRVILDDAGVTIKNPLRDHLIPWAAVTDVDLADLLRVHGTLGERRKVISAWAVHYSRRRQLAADVKARRAARTGGRPSVFGGGFASPSRGTSYGAPVSAAASARQDSAEAEAKLIVRLISDRATAARAEALRTASTPPAPASTTTSTDATTSASSVTSAAPATRGTPASAAAAAPGTGLLTSTWSPLAIAALVIPALILLIVSLL